jgi:predicted MFS family arabinose efflux permease
MNSQAVLCEKLNRTPTLGLFHGLYAIGALIGAVVCGTMIDLGLSVLEEIVIFSCAMILPSVVFSCWLFSAQEEQLITRQTESFITSSEQSGA